MKYPPVAVKKEQLSDYQNEGFALIKKSESVPSNKITGKESSPEFGSSDDRQLLDVKMDAYSTKRAVREGFPPDNYDDKPEKKQAKPGFKRVYHFALNQHKPAATGEVTEGVVPYSCHGLYPTLFHFLWFPESWVLVRVQPNFNALPHTMEDGE